MGLRMPKNVFSNKNITNVLYLVVAALSVGYLMNQQYAALMCLVVVAGVIYFCCKKIMYALGISIIVTNLLLSGNFFRRLENFKEGADDPSGKCGGGSGCDKHSDKSACDGGTGCSWTPSGDGGGGGESGGDGGGGESGALPGMASGDIASLINAVKSK